MELNLVMNFWKDLWCVLMQRYVRDYAMGNYNN